MVHAWELENAAGLLATAWAHAAVDHPDEGVMQMSFATFCSNHGIPPSRLPAIERRAAAILGVKLPK